MSKDVKFIFLDESITLEANLSSLTGVIIPMTKFEKVVSDYYKIISVIFDYLEKATGKKQQFPPILHGKDFLRNSKENKAFDFSSVTDEFRLSIFKKVIDIINDNDLFVIRLGYSNFKEIVETFTIDDKLHNLNWFNLSRTISKFYEDTLFIPVMEGIDSSIVHNFCGTIYSLNYIKICIQR